VALNSIGNELISAPKKIKIPARLFDPSVNVPTVILSVNVPTYPSVNMSTDHVSDMRALQDVRKPSVNLSVTPSVIVAQFCKNFSTL
jgi:hypothetical protein